MHRSVAATCDGFVLASAFVLGGRVGHRASARGVMDSWSVSPAGEFVYVSGVVGRRPGSQELPMASRRKCSRPSRTSALCCVRKDWICRTW